MEAGLTAEAFSSLLGRLDASEEQAGEKYEHLRRTLMRFFEWRGGPFPEELADETLSRVARKLNEGIQIANIGGYCYEVGRFVLLESLKGKDSKRVALESVHIQTTKTATDETDSHEVRLTCLDDCLESLEAESRALIVNYYSYAKSEQIKRRKVLAERLGLRRDALANRAQRVRDKLEMCVTRCVKAKVAI